MQFVKEIWGCVNKNLSFAFTLAPLEEEIKLKLFFYQTFMDFIFFIVILCKVFQFF